MVSCFDSEIDMVSTRHSWEWFCKIAWTLVWLDSPFVFCKWGICYWNKQWIVYDIPDFEDLILKLGWMFWAIN